jgi:hypothetical protein
MNSFELITTSSTKVGDPTHIYIYLAPDELLIEQVISIDFPIVRRRTQLSDDIVICRRPLFILIVDSR